MNKSIPFNYLSAKLNNLYRVSPKRIMCGVFSLLFATFHVKHLLFTLEFCCFINVFVEFK